LIFEDDFSYTTGCSKNQSKAAVAEEIEGGVVAECGDGAAFVVDCSAREGC
jgi:hypothetical protein